MNDFFNFLKEAFPPLKNHPVGVARIAVFIILLSLLYAAKDLRKRICLPLHSKLSKKIVATYRWLRVYQEGDDVTKWKYYTSEVVGWGRDGDDIIWTLVRWPSLRPKDTFRVHGAVGKLSGVEESRTTLYQRWEIVHDPNNVFGPVPARGLRSLLRRAAAKVLLAVASV
ncbi:MAG TPA: hypothetical protein VNV41_04405 [Candidatus Acidoferrales bacterium]|jgi:hypothetical protein|nr:hypothetical protein [Candidatus Acidoferrales bacterium]